MIPDKQVTLVGRLSRDVQPARESRPTSVGSGGTKLPGIEGLRMTVLNRRRFLQSAAALAAVPTLAVAATPKGKANHCIFIWLGGGMSQVDTFDPKAKGDNK